ncbi:MAG: GTP-sensing pleiotropic transcriptional regulator CodY [Lachnospiraceae bacterium]|nr:GTP-sensing pleiotropic transcriptional regulator CodY [Lachnospiraceae bacterium]
MSVELLDKTRKIGMLLHNNNSSKVVFNDICSVLTQTLSSSVLVISKKGKLLGLSHDMLVGDIAGMMVEEVGGFLDAAMNERLLSVLSTKENVNLETLGFAKEEIAGFFAIITPINIAGERFGTLFVYRQDEPYGIDDIILCEYGCTVVGLEMLRSVNEETAEEDRKKHIAKSALQTLSLTEQEAVAEVFTELSGSEGLLVASKIADRAGITRSVIVNALHKLISADVIESKSAGMKGTYIKVRNEFIFDELALLSGKGEG